MDFIETTAFSRRADALFEPGQLQALQIALAGQPELGAVISPALRVLQERAG